MIRAEDISFEYIKRDAQDNVIEIKTALDHVNLHVKKGEFVAILGKNGSGKSTFAKQVNAIFSPGEGNLYVNGMNTKELDKLYQIRQTAGMVFQNPDNQIISSVVEEDVAFGPENMGVPSGSIRKRVEQALKSVGMWKHRKDSPANLSGGQKQRVAIAGVMAMEPECIVLDEPTAMLDPGGRQDVIRTITALNKEKNITILLITHNMEETIGADKVIVMDRGKVVMGGSPREVFSQVERLHQLGLEVPFATQMAYCLRQKGILLEPDILTIPELTAQLTEYAKRTGADLKQLQRQTDAYAKGVAAPKAYEVPSAEVLSKTSSLLLKDVGYTYSPKTVYEKQALKNINLTFTKGEFVGIVGHTGSGKSTLIQHLNGTLKPTEGEIYFNGENICEKEYPLKKLRSKVGMSFQYPEYQLFEESVFDDVAFGPRNLGYDNLKVEQQSYEAIRLVGLPDTCYDMSPFDLSGGQKRRVALAGILAMNPDYLVLDEPTAGLDPEGRTKILDTLYQICREKAITVILVSHSMEEIARYADRLIVVNDGSIVYNDVPARVFHHRKEIEQMGLCVPNVSLLMEQLKEEGFPDYPYLIQQEDAVEVISRWFLS